MHQIDEKLASKTHRYQFFYKLCGKGNQPSHGEHAKAPSRKKTKKNKMQYIEKIKRVHQLHRPSLSVHKA